MDMKDYAKRNRYKKKPASDKKRGQFEIMLAGFAIFIGAIGYWVHVHRMADATEMAQQQGANTTWAAQLKAIFTHKTPEIPAEKKLLASNNAHADANEGVKFDFYTQLPAMQVNVPPVSAAKAPPVVSSDKLTADIDRSIKEAHTTKSQIDRHDGNPATSKQPYVIQLGIFKDRMAAKELRVSLLLAGVDADVVKITVQNQDNYRVQAGPYVSTKAAKLAQQKISRKGIESIILKLA